MRNGLNGRLVKLEAIQQARVSALHTRLLDCLEAEGLLLSLADRKPEAWDRWRELLEAELEADPTLVTAIKVVHGDKH